ncbi:MAG: helix-turn-helix domain-containing protein, partial [Chloroflexales bacterium]|nr:helix-turn-helix domain-containing protein [Chloroflexales bacterium]
MADRSNTVGGWLRRRRRLLDLTQAELAVRAGCVLTTIKKIETGARLPSRRLAARLSDSLALSDAERSWLLEQLHGVTTDLPLVPQAPAPQLDPAPAPSLAHPALPPPPGPLLGRSRELTALRTLLTAPASRLVTIIGPGGVGKTRLALQIAAELGDAFTDGVWFVDLAPLRDPALLPLTIARALGLEPGAAPRETLARTIGLRQMLLVLDNLEQILAAAPLLAELVAAAPNLTLLATSRAPLRLVSEQLFELPPLELPPSQQPHALDTYPAIQLFVRRAQAAQPAFALTPDNGPVVAQICQRLDGLPLAIELAAAWLTTLPPLALLCRLERRLPLLTQGPRDLPARQQTLQATLDWSFQLLPARERRLFARLAVFVGGATLEAAEQICWVAERGDILTVLRTLVEHSCLCQHPDDAGEPRFRMLETMREYAGTRLADDGDEAELRSRHAAYYLALAEAAAPQLRGPDQRRWLDRLEAEHENLRAACAWLHEARRPQEALRLVGALHWFWDRRGYLHEGRALTQQALALAEASPSEGGTLRRLRGWALIGAAALAFDQGDWAAAATSAEAAREQFGSLDEHPGLTLALLRLAFGRALYEPARGHDLLAEARAHAAAAGDPWFVGLAHFVSAQAALFGAQNTVTARARMRDAMPALRASGDPYLLAHGLATSGSIELAEGNLQAAREALEEGLVTARKLGDKRSVALIAANAADVARCQGDYERAAELYSESLGLYHELGNQAELPAILHNQGYVALGQGDVGAAQELFRESLRRQHGRGNVRGLAEGLAGLAAVAAAMGASTEAARLFGAVEALRSAHPGPMWPAERFEVERQLAALRGRLPERVFAEQWAAGRTLSLEQVIAEALAPMVGQPAP